MKLYTRYTMFNLDFLTWYTKLIGLKDVADMYGSKEYRQIIEDWCEEHGFIGSYFQMFTVRKDFRNFCKRLWRFGVRRGRAVTYDITF